MMTLFYPILEFIQHKRFCPFCNSSLIPAFTNFVLFNNKLPIVYSELNNDCFNFNIHHTSFNFSLNASCSLNIKTNVLNIKQIIEPTDGEISEFRIIEAFEYFKPHIQLSCNNKFCKMDYHCSSDAMRGYVYCENECKTISIKPFLLYFESCKFNKNIVKNDNIYGLTRIYSASKPDLDPIETPLIDFESLGKEKLKTRISTIVTFG